MFGSCSVQVSNHILSTAPNLEKAEFQLNVHIDDVEEGCPLIEKVLGEYEQLEYLEIGYASFIEEVLDAVSNGLTRAMQYEKSELKIKIYEPVYDTKGILHAGRNDKDVINKCVSIINQLASS